MANLSGRVPCMILFLMMFGGVSSDIAEDKKECADQLASLSTCLPFVGGNAKAPTSTCCTDLKKELDEKAQKCLCLLVKDRNDPNLGFKINATLALSLPSICHASANASNCLALLHLDHNSTDAQVFEQFASTHEGNSSSAIVSGIATSSSITVRGRRWLGGGMVGGISLWCLSSVFITGVY
ncbi:hypothetical protein L1049_009033 [Liquidambar formosana]|uniref:Bifunctional inhibitor/plant lipid transfer protein/seed storage helical domain-containing protein n=1 Tax=Liquidambar formosana TaxID=63359 RepID=A0AAP0SAL5_LIQFO